MSRFILPSSTISTGRRKFPSCRHDRPGSGRTLRYGGRALGGRPGRRNPVLRRYVARQRDGADVDFCCVRDLPDALSTGPTVRSGRHRPDGENPRRVDNFLAVDRSVGRRFARPREPVGSRCPIVQHIVCNPGTHFRHRRSVVHGGSAHCRARTAVGHRICGIAADVGPDDWPCPGER